MDEPRPTIECSKHMIESPSGRVAVYHYGQGRGEKGSLLCVHGGPGGDHRGNDGIFDQMVDSCVPMGYEVIQFDMYGTGASDGGPEDITLTTQVDDYGAVLNYTRSEGAQPYHVVGESMGATVAAMHWQQDVASYILLWPAFDLRDTDLRPYLAETWLEKARRQGSIQDEGMTMGRGFLEEITNFDFGPCFHLPNIPSLVLHGKQDGAVPFKQSLKAVEMAHGPAVLFAHPSGDHGLQGTAEREYVKEAYQWWLSRAV